MGFDKMVAISLDSKWFVRISDPHCNMLFSYRTRLFENLRMLPHAPGVQMATIPEDGIILKEESALEDEANPDKRNPHQLRDKQVH